MTNITMVPKFLEASLYLIRIIAQILYYCWFSNEVKLKVRHRNERSPFLLNVSCNDILIAESRSASYDI